MQRVALRPSRLVDASGQQIYQVHGADQTWWISASTRDQIVQGSGGDGPFKGASSVRRAGALWSAANGSADADFLPSQETLRARSRQLCRNNPLAAGAINTLVSNVIGTGLRLCPEVDRDALGMGDEEAEALERQLLRIWTGWSESCEADLNRIQWFSQLQGLAYRSTKESGDCLVLAPLVNRPGATLQTRVQIVEADRICNPNFQATSERLAGGVELDEYGAPVAYHVLKGHPGDWFGLRGVASQRVRAFGSASGRRNAWLVYNRTRPGQHRGVPYLAGVLEQLKQLERYTDAELHAAVISGAFTVFVKTQDGQGLAPLASLPFTDTTTATSATSQSDIALDYGAIVDLAPGEDVEFANPGRPNTAFGDFVKAMAKQVGAGIGMGYELLTRSFEVSYSAARANLLEAWKFFATERQDFGIGFCHPCYEIVISEAVARGILEIEDFLENPSRRRAILRCSWLGPSPGQINPIDEVEAATMRVEGGFSSMQYETAQLTGQDWETVLLQRKKEAAAQRDAGLLPPEDQGRGQDRAAARQTSRDHNRSAMMAA